MQPSLKDCLQILGIDPKDCTWDKVQSAYRKSLLQHHPDKGGRKEDVEKVIAAFHELKLIREKSPGIFAGKKEVDTVRSKEYEIKKAARNEASKIRQIVIDAFADKIMCPEFKEVSLDRGFFYIVGEERRHCMHQFMKHGNVKVMIHLCNKEEVAQGKLVLNYGDGASDITICDTLPVINMSQPAPCGKDQLNVVTKYKSGQWAEIRAIWWKDHLKKLELVGVRGGGNEGISTFREYMKEKKENYWKGVHTASAKFYDADADLYNAIARGLERAANRESDIGKKNKIFNDAKYHRVEAERATWQAASLRSCEYPAAPREGSAHVASEACEDILAEQRLGELLFS
jgi:hypothetical protein